MPATICQLQTDLAKVMSMLHKLTESNASRQEVAEPHIEVHVVAESHDEEEEATILEVSSTTEHDPSSDANPDGEESEVHDSGPPPNQEAWMQQRQQRKRSRRNQQRQAEGNSDDKRTVTLIADSIPKHIDTDFIKRKTSAKVCYIQEGGNISKTTDFIQDNADELKDQPIIIHTGTNDVVRESSQTTERRLLRLVTNLRHHKYKHVSLSSIVCRSSTVRIQDTIKQHNTMLQMTCLRNKWLYIDNDAINSECLDSDGLHLNGLGTEKLTYTIAKGVNDMLFNANH